MITIRGVKRTKSVSDAILSDPLEGQKYLDKAEAHLLEQIHDLMEQFGYEGELSMTRENGKSQ